MYKYLVTYMVYRYAYFPSPPVNYEDRKYITEQKILYEEVEVNKEIKNIEDIYSLEKSLLQIIPQINYEDKIKIIGFSLLRGPVEKVTNRFKDLL